MKKIVYLFFVLNAMYCGAQDIHWSQFNDNPIFQNPANSGNFNGDYRFIANYRDQWRSVTVPYSTISFSADSKLKQNNALRYGILFFHDVVGDGKFRTTELQLNLAYQLDINTKQNLKIGLNAGMNHRSFDFEKFYFGNQFNGVSYDPNLSNNENLSIDKKTNFNIGLGLAYHYQIAERKSITAGFSAFNLNRPDQGFYGTKIRRDIRTTYFIKANYKLNYDWDLLPSIQFNLQGVYREFILGSSIKYTLVDRLGEYRALYAGLWFRYKDATYLTVGMDYQNWFFGVSYDINVSKLVPASHVRGGIEFAVRYILHQFKPSKNTHRVCPDFI